MQEWVDVLEKSERMLKVKLKSMDMLDLTLFERFKHDDLCLGCIMDDTNRGIITYSVQDYIPLDYFLDHCTFKSEEAYIFLDNLFTLAIAANRNKPIVFDPEFIYVSAFGDTFRFVGVPVTTENWMAQKEVCIRWVEYLTKHLKTTSNYEINGFLLCFLESPEFSLPNLILSLKALRKKYYPKKLFVKQKKTFVLKEPVRYQLHYENNFMIHEIPPLQEKTQIINVVNQSKAHLEKDGQQFPIVCDSVMIGRAMSCDIRIDSMDVSLKHARITCMDDKFYIQDLKSSNKTYLNEKCVQRKMRLKDGMKIKFASQEFVFHQ